MILVNGQPGNQVDARDRGLAYGDGVFRTLRTQAGRPLWWRDHYAKLATDCAALMLACPDEAVLHAEICQVAEAGEGVVKVMLTRGAGARGYAPAARPIHDPHRGARAAAGLRADRRTGCDHGALVQPSSGATAPAGGDQASEPAGERARARRMDRPGNFEGLLCDDLGAVIGGVMSNLLIIKDGELFTPDLAECGVAGVARTRLLRAAPHLGIPTHIGRLLPAAVLAADEVMICNSVIGVRRVARLDDVTWPSAGWTAAWNNALYEDLD